MKITHHTFETDPPVTLPIVRFKGKKKGKTGFISGGIHGDEINGMILVKKFIDDFKKNKLEKEMRGELIIMPLLNPTGFLRGHRKAHPDKKDINRSFPGSKRGSFSEQFAKELFDKFISKVDFGIDCHDAGSQSALLPHTRVNSCATEDDKCLTQNLGRLFGTEIIVERSGKDGMMALEAFREFRKPLITVEIGGAKHIFDHFVKEGVEGLKNILKHYNMIPGKTNMLNKQYILKSRFGIKAESTGIIELHVELGDYVHAGQKIGIIYHPQTFEEKVLISPMCGLVFSLHDHQIIKKNRIMYSILETKKCHVTRTTLDKFKEIRKNGVETIIM